MFGSTFYRNASIADLCASEYVVSSRGTDGRSLIKTCDTPDFLPDLPGTAPHGLSLYLDSVPAPKDQEGGRSSSYQVARSLDSDGIVTSFIFLLLIKLTFTPNH